MAIHNCVISKDYKLSCVGYSDKMYYHTLSLLSCLWYDVVTTVWLVKYCKAEKFSKFGDMLQIYQNFIHQLLLAPENS